MLSATPCRSAESQLQHIAFHDSLTGLANRARFREALAHAIARTQADPARAFAVMFLDFDRFKLINDTLGHSVGDQFLVAATQRIVGVPAVDDLNAEAMEQAGACGIPNITVGPDALRVSTASAYLRQAMGRPNLQVRTGALVHRVVVREGRARGVVYAWQGQVHEASAATEVVLSLGAVNTAKVLMLSCLLYTSPSPRDS